MDDKSLNDFISRLRGTGLQTASHYAVAISSNIPGQTDNDVWMMCDSINVPGFQIMSSDFRTYGEMRDVPYGISYPQLNASFILDNTMAAKYLIDAWSNLVYDRKKRTSGYYKNFVRDIKILMKDNDPKRLGVTYALDIKECWPKSVSDIQLSYSDHESPRLNVSFAFKYLEQAQMSSADVSKLANRVKTSNKELFDKSLTHNPEFDFGDNESIWYDAQPFFSDLNIPLVTRGGIPVPLEVAVQLDLATSELIRLRQAHPPIY